MVNLETLIEQTENLINQGDYEALNVLLEDLNISEVKELIDEFPEEGTKFLAMLPMSRAVHVFRILDFPVQERIIKKLPGNKIAELINELPPDDRTSFFSELKSDVVKQLIILLPTEDRKEALSLLGYAEDSIGRLMTPDYVAVKKDWKVSRVLEHIRRYGVNSETIDVIYVIDENGVLLDDLRIRKILLADPETKISELTDDRLIYLNANDHQEEAIQIFRLNNRVALPVTDDNRVLLGIITVDDILWVANEEYTEDMQKIGGTEALDEPYLDVTIWELVKKRAGWLMVLFVGQLFTATVIEHFEGNLAKATMLVLFIPLIMSSGGNSGSQASTLVIQAMAMGDVKLNDWWRVMRREIIAGALLGLILGLMGMLRIYGYQIFTHVYGEHWILVGLTVSLSILGVVLWGSLVGAMLPFILKKLGADPASSSAPFVSTLVDVTGLLLYLSIATLILTGILL
jgi:magnesium transporter